MNEKSRYRYRARYRYRLFFLPLLLFFSCGSPSHPPQSQEFRISLHTEPPTFDSRKATDATAINLIHMCFEGLLREDGPGVASHYEVNEEKTKYTFYFRDAQWSDGSPVTASDFAATWLEVLSPTFASEFAHELFVIKNAKGFKEGKLPQEEVGIKVIDEKTLEVNLEHPTTYFTELVTTSYFFPYKENVSNGPFRMTVWKHYDEVRLVKNETYWDAAQVNLQKIFLPIIQDESTELSMYENGELDWAGAPLSTIPLDSLPSVLKNHSLQTFPIAGTYFYLFNTEEPPFNNLNMRRAFTLAIDRQVIIDNILQGDQKPALTFVPPNLWEKPSPPAFADHDVVEAKRLFALGLQELGGTLPTITLSYNTAEGHHKIAQAIQQQWKKAFGIDVQLENKEWKVFLNETNKHQFQIARMGGLAAYGDPVTFLDLSITERTGWENQKYEELLEMASQAISSEKRQNLLHAAEGVLLHDMPVAPIYFYACSYLKKPYVEKVTLTKTGLIDLKYAYLHP